MNQWVKVAIGLGANLGEREKTIQLAIEKLGTEFLEDSRASALYESKPWGIADQPDFMNAVVTGRCEWKPPAIINYLKTLEKELGRRTTVKNGPRVIDLDLLIYGDEVWKSEGVIVPHPGLPERSFVLLPLQELWSDWQHPQTKKTVSELVRALPTLQDCWLKA